MNRLVKEDGVVAISVPSAHYGTFKYWFYCKQPLAKWMRRKLPGNMDGSRVLCHNHMITPSLKTARLMMKKAGLKVIYAAPYCSGLSGGSAGKILRIAGKMRQRRVTHSMSIRGRPRGSSSSAKGPTSG